MKKAILTAVVFILAGAAGVIAGANTAGPAAEKMWKALDLMARFEQLPIHVVDGGKDSLEVESLACAYENYYACSFSVKINGISRLVVDTEAAGKIIEAMTENGFFPDEDDGTLYIKKVSCSNAKEQYSCVFE